MIRRARAALTSLLATNGQQPYDQLLRSMMCEVENIVNNRPISVVHMSSDTNKLEPLRQWRSQGGAEGARAPPIGFRGPNQRARRARRFESIRQQLEGRNRQARWFH